MSKKSARGPLSKNSSAASSGAASAKQNGTKSSILKSAFAPSHFQLALFASVIQGLESQQLRIQDTNNGRLRCQHSASPDCKITCLDWGYFDQEQDHKNKQKKRKREGTKTEHVVVAYGTSTSEVCMVSTTEGKIVGRLKGGHERGINAFRFSPQDASIAYSIGGDGMLAEWDVPQGQCKRRIHLDDSVIGTLSLPSSRTPQILYASMRPYALDLSNSTPEIYDAHRHPIHSLFRSGIDDGQSEELFLAVDTDRYINISNLNDKKLARTLVSGGDIESASIFTPSEGTKSALTQQMLSVHRKDGSIELFAKPFLAASETQVNGDLSAKRKSMTRKANALVRLTASESNGHSPTVFASSLQGPELLVALVQGGVHIFFEKVRWQDEITGELLFGGTKEVMITKVASTLNSVSANGVKDQSKAQMDESRVVVVAAKAEGSSPQEAITLSSSEDESEAENESEVSERRDEDGEEMQPAHQSAEVPVDEESAADSDEEMEDADQEPASADAKALAIVDNEAEDTEPSFGDLMATQNGAVISIGDVLAPEATAVVSKGSKAPTFTDTMSLTTVLSQSLRTNDNNLLESCLHNQSTDIIQATIQRLDSSLAGTLIQKLAERISARPGRYGHLISWVQSICVMHGAALASQPSSIEKMQTLHNVLAQRSRCLEPLLLLKGKLDMLDAQLKFRRQLRLQRQQQRPQDENGLIMIEGKDNWSSSDEDARTAISRKAKGKEPRRNLDEISDIVSSNEDENDEDEVMTTTLPNGVHSTSDSDEEESEEESDSDPNGQTEGALIESEAEESGSDLDDDESDGGEDDNEDEDEEADSEMDSFINDGSIAEVADDHDIDLDDADEDEDVDEVSAAAARPSKKSRLT